MSTDKSLFYKKLVGKWKATFSNERETVDVEITFHDDSTGSLKYLMGVKSRVMPFEYRLGQFVELADGLIAFEYNQTTRKAEYYKGTELERTKRLKKPERLFSIISFQSENELYLPLPKTRKKGMTLETRITELSQESKAMSFHRVTALVEKENKLLDNLFSGTNIILELAGIIQYGETPTELKGKTIEFQEKCNNKIKYTLSKYNAELYGSNNKQYQELGCTRERVERFFWIYTLFNHDRNYISHYPLKHWKNKESIDQAFSIEKQNFNQDPSLMLYWTLHFGFLQDKRYHKLKQAIGQLDYDYLHDAVALIDTVSNQSTHYVAIQQSWYKHYYQFLFNSAYKLGYEAILHSYIYDNSSPNSKAYWIVKNANEQKAWESVDKSLKVNVSETYLGYSYIQANNPLLSADEQRIYTDRYLNEMMTNFDRYSKAQNAFYSIINIYKKTDNLPLLQAVSHKYFSFIMNKAYQKDPIDKYNDLVGYLRKKGLTTIEYFASDQEVMLEKIDTEGYKHAKIIQYQSFIVQLTHYIDENNDRVKKETHHANTKKLKEKFKEKRQYFLDNGFIKVTTAGELKEKLGNKQFPKPIAKQMSLEEFVISYPDIELDEQVWFRDISVYEEDATIEGDIDLDTEDPFFNPSVFLKNLEVKGDIVNRVAETGFPIHVEGTTRANSIIAGGAFLNFKGDVILRDLLAVYYNDGALSLSGDLTARVLLYDDDHDFSGPEKPNLSIWVGDHSHSENAPYKSVDYKKLAESFMEEAWVETVEDIDSEENTFNYYDTSAWKIVKHIKNFSTFSDKMIQVLGVNSKNQ